MEIPKLVLLLSCIYHSFASEHSHVIPVENYETELQDLGTHVESHNPPAKVIKITKTIAVKIPVPYPVKVIEKVPYPVHIAKPYPVPVPQIVHVPKHDSQPQKPHQQHEVLDVPHDYVHNSQQQSNQDDNQGHYGPPESHSSPYGGNFDFHQNFGGDHGGDFGGNDHEHGAETHGAHDNGDSGSLESNNQYLHQQHHPHTAGSFSYH